MARDLIPPPSPAGRPEPETSRGTFSKSELLRTDAEQQALLEATTPVEPLAESRYRSRFGFVLGALVGLGLAALVIIGLVATSGDEIRRPPWSAWQPEEEEPELRALEIADHVGRQYRLDSGDQLTSVYAQWLEIEGTPLNLVMRSAGAGEGADIVEVPGRTLLFVLKGLGPRGSIDTEKPSLERLRLVQREAYELALYAFKYVDGVDNVVAYLPPAPPDAEPTAEQKQLGKAFASPVTAEAATADAPLPAMMFLPGDLEASLETPLASTFPAAPPRPSTISDAEVDTFGALAQIHAFDASVISDQTGAGFLVLDRLNQAEAAQEQVRSTLKA